MKRPNVACQCHCHEIKGERSRQEAMVQIKALDRLRLAAHPITAPLCLMCAIHVLQDAKHTIGDRKMKAPKKAGAR
jgi:hypothetical protein